MKGSVRKRGSTWSYRFDIGKVAGKRKRMERGGFATKKEAEAALTKAIAEYQNGGLVFEPATISLADYLDYWFNEYYRLNMKPNTVRRVQATVNNRIIPALGNYKLNSITPAVVQIWVNDMHAEGLKRSTIKSHMTVLSSALRYAVYPMQYIKSNPVHFVRLPKRDKSSSNRQTRTIITPEEFTRIADRFKDTYFYLPLMIGWYTGLRIDECFALTWDDIDLEENTLTVSRTLVHIPATSAANPYRGDKTQSPYYAHTPKTGMSQRTVDFGPALHQCLAEAKHEQSLARLKRGPDYRLNFLETVISDSGPIEHIVIRPQFNLAGTESMTPAPFVNIQKNGKFYSPYNFPRANRIIVNEMGIPFDYHSLRHTHASMLAAAGVPPKVVQERLGHTQVITTLSYYTHTTKNDRQKAAATFESIMLK